MKIKRNNFIFSMLEYISDFKLLHLHLKVQQPGKFCCNDGFCLESKYVCDKLPHCEDGEDEAWDICGKVSMNDDYKDDQAPVGFELVNHELVETKTVVNISVAIFDLVNIDIDNAFFKVNFRKVLNNIRFK